MTIDHLNNIETTIMHLLHQADRECYGYELSNMSKGDVKVGSVYVMLHRMQEKGLLTSRIDPSNKTGAPMRLYKFTECGLRAHIAYCAFERAMAECNTSLKG